jgi:hypothetical protein
MNLLSGSDSEGGIATGDIKSVVVEASSIPASVNFRLKIANEGVSSDANSALICTITYNVIAEIEVVSVKA